MSPLPSGIIAPAQLVPNPALPSFYKSPFVLYDQVLTGVYSSNKVMRMRFESPQGALQTTRIFTGVGLDDVLTMPLQYAEVVQFGFVGPYNVGDYHLRIREVLDTNTTWDLNGVPSNMNWEAIGGQDTINLALNQVAGTSIFAIFVIEIALGTLPQPTTAPVEPYDFYARATIELRHTRP